MDFDNHYLLLIIPFLLLIPASRRGHKAQERKLLVFIAISSTVLSWPMLFFYAQQPDNLLIQLSCYGFVLTSSLAWALLLREQDDTPKEYMINDQPLPEPGEALDWDEIENWLGEQTSNKKVLHL